MYYVSWCLLIASAGMCRNVEIFHRCVKALRHSKEIVERFLNLKFKL